MSVTEMSIVDSAPPSGRVELGGLVCPGCGDPVADAAPSGWPARAGRAPEFSHRDGSVLCPDGRGRVPEPIEAVRVRYGLTEAGARALNGSAGVWS